MSAHLQCRPQHQAQPCEPVPGLLPRPQAPEPSLWIGPSAGGPPSPSFRPVTVDPVPRPAPMPRFPVCCGATPDSRTKSPDWNLWLRQQSRPCGLKLPASDPDSSQCQPPQASFQRPYTRLQTRSCNPGLRVCLNTRLALTDPGARLALTIPGCWSASAPGWPPQPQAPGQHPWSQVPGSRLVLVALGSNGTRV